MFSFVITELSIVSFVYVTSYVMGLREEETSTQNCNTHADGVSTLLDTFNTNMIYTTGLIMAGITYYITASIIIVSYRMCVSYIFVVRHKINYLFTQAPLDEEELHQLTMDPSQNTRQRDELYVIDEDKESDETLHEKEHKQVLDSKDGFHIQNQNHKLVHHIIWYNVYAMGASLLCFVYTIQMFTIHGNITMCLCLLGISTSDYISQYISRPMSNNPLSDKYKLGRRLLREDKLNYVLAPATLVVGMSLVCIYTINHLSKLDFFSAIMMILPDMILGVIISAYGTVGCCAITRSSGLSTLISIQTSAPISVMLGICIIFLLVGFHMACVPQVGVHTTTAEGSSYPLVNETHNNTDYIVDTTTPNKNFETTLLFLVPILCGSSIYASLSSFIQEGRTLDIAVGVFTSFWVQQYCIHDSNDTVSTWKTLSLVLTIMLFVMHLSYRILSA